MDAHPEGGGTAKIRAYKVITGLNMPEHQEDFIDRYGYPFCRGRILHVVEEDRGQYDVEMPVFWAREHAFVSGERVHGSRRFRWTFLWHMKK
jgi:hypothetical protein